MTDKEKAKAWIQIHDSQGKGVKFFPLSMTDRVDILAAARATCYLCRYSGNLLTGVRKPWHALRPGTPDQNTYGSHIYSVGQHSLIVSWILLCEALNFIACNDVSFDDMVHALSMSRIGLAHDLTEGCGIGDMPHPIKKYVSGFGGIETQIWERIRKSCNGLPEILPDSVNDWDRQIVATEKRDFMGQEPDQWQTQGLPELPLRIRPMNPLRTYRRWVERWDHLCRADRIATIMNDSGNHDVERLLNLYLPKPGLAVWNQIRYAIGIRYVTDGSELYGIWNDCGDQDE